MPTVILWTIVFALLAILLYTDGKKRILPNRYILLLAIFSSLLMIISDNAGERLEGGAVMGGWFVCLYLVSKRRWTGGGDVKLAPWLGLLIGWPHIMVTLLTAYLLGVAHALILLTMKKATLKTRMPMGSYLIAAALLTLGILKFFPSSLNVF